MACIEVIAWERKVDEFEQVELKEYATEYRPSVHEKELPGKYDGINKPVEMKDISQHCKKRIIFK